MALPQLLAGAACLLAGYIVGRASLGPRIVDWAEAATVPGWRTWKFWCGAPVVLAAIAAIWITHPYRSLTNVRSWRAAPEWAPAPQPRRIGHGEEAASATMNPTAAKEPT